MSSANRPLADLFNILLEKWNLPSSDRVGICDKIEWLLIAGFITTLEHDSMMDAFQSKRKVAIRDFGSSDGIYWWRSRDQEIRKQFIKYIIENQ